VFWKRLTITSNPTRATIDEISFTTGGMSESLCHYVLCNLNCVLTLGQKLVKVTWPDHVDYEDLQKALSHVTKVAKIVEAQCAEADRVARVLQIQTSLTELPPDVCVSELGRVRVIFMHVIA